jgi:single-strand DNA-binding protein
MNDVNTVALIGRLAADPELRQAGQTSVLRMRLVVNRDRKRGERWEEQAHFFNVDLFRGADTLQRYLHKGSRIAVSGHLEFRQWEQDGAKRSMVSVLADSIQMLDPKPASSTQERLPANRYDDDQRRAERYERDTERVPDRSDIPNDLDEDESDIPFLWREVSWGDEHEHTHSPSGA